MNTKPNWIPKYVSEDARILFRNFSGDPTKFNPEGGKREFTLVIDPEHVASMEADGWNIRELAPREGYPDDETRYVLKVAVSYNPKVRPPSVVLITNNGTRRQNLDEELVGMLDWTRFKTVDVIVNPSRWDVNGNTGVKAYLDSIYVTVEEDDLELKYADLEEVGTEDIPRGQVRFEPSDEQVFND